MNEIKITCPIGDRTDATKIFDVVMSIVEKEYESIFGFFSVTFQDLAGTRREILKLGPKEEVNDNRRV